MSGGSRRARRSCQLVGITYRQLDYWARTGLLRPSLAEAKGSGTKRRYSYRDLLELKVIKQLLDAGVSCSRPAGRSSACARTSGADLASANLVLTGPDSVLAQSNGEVVDLLAGGQGVFNIVPLSGVVNELDADIVRLERGGRRDRGGTRHRRPGPEPPGSDATRPGAPGGSLHPVTAPAATGALRPPLRAALRRLARRPRIALGVRAGRVRPALGRRRLTRRRGSGPTSGCPTTAASSS